MHKRLRRQLADLLDADEAARPGLRRLWREIDAEYLKADQDRSALAHALDLVGDLVRRPAGGAEAAPAPRVGASPLPRLRRQLFERAPFAAFICDPRLEVLAWNGSAERQFGYRGKEAVGRELGDLLFPVADRAPVRRELLGLLERGEVDQSLRVAASKTGEARLDEWTVVPLPDQDASPWARPSWCASPSPPMTVTRWPGRGPATASSTGTCAPTGSGSPTPGSSWWGSRRAREHPVTGWTASTRPTARESRRRCGPTWPAGRPASSASTAYATRTVSGAGCWPAPGRCATPLARPSGSAAR